MNDNTRKNIQNYVNSNSILIQVQENNKWTYLNRHLWLEVELEEIASCLTERRIKRERGLISQSRQREKNETGGRTEWKQIWKFDVVKCNKNCRKRWRLQLRNSAWNWSVQKRTVRLHKGPERRRLYFYAGYSHSPANHKPTFSLSLSSLYFLFFFFSFFLKMAFRVVSIFHIYWNIWLLYNYDGSIHWCFFDRWFYFPPQKKKKKRKCR